MCFLETHHPLYLTLYTLSLIIIMSKTKIKIKQTEFVIFIPDKCPTLRIAFSPINPRAPRADLAFSSDIVGSVSLTFLVTTSVAVAS